MKMIFHGLCPMEAGLEFIINKSREAIWGACLYGSVPCRLYVDEEGIYCEHGKEMKITEEK